MREERGEEETRKADRCRVLEDVKYYTKEFRLYHACAVRRC